jgi:drug/metabolite transporter (DMT)-like permease
VILAALLYLGAGAVLSATALLSHRRNTEARLRAGDLPLIGAIVLFGGVLGPILMLWGLDRVSAVLGSPLLNLEAPFTILIGVVFFGDHLSSRTAAASALIISGAAALGSIPVGLEAAPLGAVAIAGACASWALDNNLTQRLSLRDPVAVARTKALAAGIFMLGLAFAHGERMPAGAVLVPAILLGAVAYGLSLVFAVYAMRILGVARQAVFFASAPFVGAILSMPLLGERPGLEVAAGGALIVAGLVVLLRERHSHWHTHAELDHDHAHVHDEHHQHHHDPAVSPIEPHSHPHHHERSAHAHPHVPDLHHHHRH